MRPMPSLLVINHWSLAFFVWSLVLGHWSLTSIAVEVQGPLSPEDAQKAMVLADSSLRIELAAAEPEVIDPVAVRFDEDGHMWVVQMSDYPLGNPTGGDPLSKIRVLEDKDGDGRYETATTFAEKLLFITGLQPWKGGVFVTRSGKLTYMKDTDGDGRADLDEVWFEGFAEQNSQLRANHPRLALDNWIYVANGLRGGQVINRKLGETKPINISGMDFRFNPLTGVCEAVSGNGQFGLCFDDWGNRFTCSNRNPVKHVVIEDRYLKANPGVTVPATVSDVAAFGEQSRIFPISRAWTTSNLHAGQFTAACGVYVYRGDLLPAEFKGNAFTCDPTGNLIHREIIQPAGPTFTSKPAYEGKEFLASKDEWFRPVNMELGPDGALYVVDMYRCVIEHPDFVPDELKRRPDLRLGDDRGRIWRIVPASGRGDGDTNPTRQRGTSANTSPKRERRIPQRLSQLSSEALIPLVEHSNAWQRETAQRLLLEREWRPADDRLMVLATTSSMPQGRVHALSLMRFIGPERKSRLTVVNRLLADDHPQVRRHALFAAASDGYAAQARNCLVDKAPEVRFAARLSVPSMDGYSQLVWGSFADELCEAAVRDADDPWQRFAIRASVKDDEQAERFLAYLLKSIGHIRKASAGSRSLIRETTEQFVASAKPESAQSLALEGARMLSTAPETAIEALLGGMRGLARKNMLPQGATQLASEHNSTIATIRKAAEDFVADRESEINVRRDAMELLSYLPGMADNIAAFAAPKHEQVIRLAAITALSRQSRPRDWQLLLDGFSSDTPPIRRAIIDGLLSNTERTKLLLDAIEASQIKPSEIDLAQVKRLTSHRDSAIKSRAEKLLAAATPADRAKALADYQPVLQMKGDPQHGQAVFEKNCSACHRIAGIGTTVAPDISDSRTKKYDQLLADILQPNRAIDNNYLGYTVRTLGGEVLTGILTAETATSITLRQQGGKDAVIPRSEIDELKSSGVSLMPEGLERNIPLKEMADLLAFIKNWRYLDGRTPLSEQ
jgi:putative membrane-bound dehydrogenase-like protein